MVVQVLLRAISNLGFRSRGLLVVHMWMKAEEVFFTLNLDFLGL